MFLLYSMIILLFPSIIGINILIYNLTVKKAIKKIIEPKLKENGYSFVGYEWPGFLSNGDFKANNINIRTMSKNGRIINSMYAYIFYKRENEAKKITVQIDTLFFIIRNVFYSSEI